MFTRTEKFNIPTKEEPFILESLEDGEPIFYYDIYAETEGEKYFYENLSFIWYHANKEMVNGFTTVHKVQCFLFFFHNKELFFPVESLDFDQTLTMNFQKGLLPVGNKWVNRLNFIYTYLKQHTFEGRLTRYGNFFIKDGYVYLNEDTRLYNNGDIKEGEKFIGNIKTAFEQNKFFYGENYSHMKNSYTNPYDFGIYLSDGFLGFGKKAWRIPMCLNKDIMDVLIPRLIRDDKFI